MVAVARGLDDRERWRCSVASLGVGIRWQRFSGQTARQLLVIALGNKPKLAMSDSAVDRDVQPG